MEKNPENVSSEIIILCNGFFISRIGLIVYIRVPLNVIFTDIRNDGP